MSKPHKCPVCDGTGNIIIGYSTSTADKCNACDGTGIVWEPEPKYEGVRI